MAGTARYSKMTSMINYRIRVALVDGRVLVGQLLAFDKYMNVVLSDCEEFRRTKKASAIAASKKKAIEEGVSPSIASIAANMEERRTFGLLVLRGENIISLVVESGPPPDSSISFHFQKPSGPALVPGTTGPVPGLAGAVRGVASGMPMAARPPPMPVIPGLTPSSLPPGMVMPPPPGMPIPPLPAGMVAPPPGMMPPLPQFPPNKPN